MRISRAIVAALFLVACAPATDRDRYEVGEAGVVTFANRLGETFYLGGCNHFDYEKREGDAWVSQGADLVCVWEGFAQPVARGDVMEDPIRAREPGTWRLRYPVGIGCSDTAPLAEAHCTAIGEVSSNEFEVVASSCQVTGCSGHVCADAPVVTTCEWLPEYECYRAARCGRFGPGGACGWEPTDELAECLERLR